MPKAFAILGLIVGLCLLLVFGLDLGTGFPFHKASMTMDVGFVICPGLVVHELDDAARTAVINGARSWCHRWLVQQCARTRC